MARVATRPASTAAVGALAAAAAALALGAPTAADAAPPLRCTLTQCSERAIERSPLVAAARVGIEHYRSRLAEAHSLWFPKFQIEGFGSVLPALRPGRDGSKPFEDYDLTRLGPLGVGSLGVAQTLYTFGKIDALSRLASQGIDISKTTVRIAEDEMRYQIARAWWGLVLVADLRELIDEVKRMLDETRARLEKQRDDGDPEFNQNDLLKLNVHSAEIEEKLRQFERNRQQALDGLRQAMDDPSGFEVEAAGDLTSVAIPDLPIEAIEALATANAPRLLAYRGGVQARLIQVEVVRAQRWPDLLFVARVAGTYAPTRDSNADSLASNPSNTAVTGLGVVLRWTLDVWRSAETVRQAELEARQAGLALRGEIAKVRADARQSWREMTDARALIAVQDKACRAARGLLTSEAQAWDDGIGDYAEVLRAMESYTRRRLAFAESIYTYNLAVAALSRQVGADLTRLAGAGPAPR